MARSKSQIFRFDDVEVREREFTLVKAGEELTVEPKAFRALLFLLHNPQKLISKEELLNSVWGDAAVTEGSLTRCIWLLRTVLGDDIRNPRYIATVATVGYRFICKVEVSEDVSGNLEWTGQSVWSSGVEAIEIPAKGDAPQATAVNGEPRVSEAATASATASHAPTAIRLVTPWKISISVLLAALLVAGVLYYRSHRSRRLTETDTIILADFKNRTSDSVFDGTLREGLSVQLEQSPFLRIIPDQKIRETLQMMGQSQEAKLTPEIGRELCQRTGSAAVLNGSIAEVGTHYLLTIKAVNCVSGESLASAEAQASDKNHVLDALGRTASEIRSELGESLSAVRQFNTPLEQATTPSLEALQAYSMGRRIFREDPVAAVTLFEQAIRLDPNFAMAHLSLGLSQLNLGETSQATESFQKAYSLSGHVSQWEKFAIESRYYYGVAGDLEKARQSYELWAIAYPRDPIPVDMLGTIYAALGQHDKALAIERDAFRLNPSGNVNNLVPSSLNLNRLDETMEWVKKLGVHDGLHLYQVAFLRNDAAGMAQEVALATGMPGVEDIFLDLEAQTAAYSGRLAKAREFSQRAVASAEMANEKETAAGYEAEAALCEALFGNMAEARQRATAALGLSTGRDVQYLAAIAQAFAGDESKAQALGADLARRFPEDTIVQFNYLPTINAQLALSHDDSSKSIEALVPAAPYELGTEGNGLVGGAYLPALHPVYVRGEAYLAAHRGGEAAAEFQKILDHRGVVVSQAIGALAHLQIGRAYAMAGDKTQAKAAYQDFFALWRDADPEIPILKAAKAEYTKLR